MPCFAGQRVETGACQSLGFHSSQWCLVIKDHWLKKKKKKVNVIRKMIGDISKLRCKRNITMECNNLIHIEPWLRVEWAKTFLGQLGNWKYGLDITGDHGIIVDFIRYGIVLIQDILHILKIYILKS